MIHTGPKSRHRSKSVGRHKQNGYSTDFVQRQKAQDEEAVDYENLNEEFGDVSVSGKFLAFGEIWRTISDWLFLS